MIVFYSESIIIKNQSWHKYRTDKSTIIWKLYGFIWAVPNIVWKSKLHSGQKSNVSFLTSREKVILD